MIGATTPVTTAPSGTPHQKPGWVKKSDTALMPSILPAATDTTRRVSARVRLVP